MKRTLLLLLATLTVASSAMAGGPTCEPCNQPRGILHGLFHHKKKGDPAAPANPAGPPPCVETLQNVLPHGETMGRGPDPGEPAPMPSMTLWRFLGVPQAFQGLSRRREARVNADGTEPWKERKPPLLPLADPLNLLSDNPAIAAAAKIKAEEDLAQQKIKAIRYLAMIGCGCYKGVDEALLAALDDCTEEVRYEAAKAIAESAKGSCKNCGNNACCNRTIHEKLMKIIYDQDDLGCPIEPSARVRAAAARALCACPPPPPKIVKPVDNDPPPVISPEALEEELEERREERLEDAIEDATGVEAEVISTQRAVTPRLGPQLSYPSSMPTTTSRRPTVIPQNYEVEAETTTTTSRYPSTSSRYPTTRRATQESDGYALFPAE